ncbi:MAG: hypothetical protein LBK65_01095 [Tannerellaceae bacterium]|jgi:hypothetical protein|nr:hypothetical protein [Tannerellaceae bacterium]
MDKLKDFIDKNRDSFDNEPLPEGHLERFEKKLANRKRSRQPGRVAIAVAMAAAAALLLFLKIQHETSVKHYVFTCEAEKEIEELRLYYQMQIYDVETQIKELYANGATRGSLELMEETERVIQTTYDFEADVMPTLPCSDVAVFAITQHYGNSIGSLNFMLSRMKQIVTNGSHN